MQPKQTKQVLLRNKANTTKNRYEKSKCLVVIN